MQSPNRSPYISSKLLRCALAGASVITLVVSVGVAAQSAPMPKYGQPVTEEDLANWNIDIRTPDSAGLPAGSGSVDEGKVVYDNSCASCHGANADGGPVYGAMYGGVGSFMTDKRKLTIGSMYPFPGILFDYVKRAMPMDAAQSLTDDEVYAVSAYLFHLNDLVPADAVLDAKSLSEIEMPNRDGFIVDDRPDAAVERCMKDCPPINSSS